MKSRFFIIGMIVGVVFSLDNSVGTAVLSSIYGSNLWLLIGEIISHIGVIVIAWFIGSKIEAESKLFTIVAAGCMWILAIWELVGG